MVWLFGILLGSGVFYGLWRLARSGKLGGALESVTDGIVDGLGSIDFDFSDSSSSGGYDGGCDGGGD
ncbi:MAG: hypothetical protein CTY12_08650 [Methylotenera sp.]|nr:MAG: hypothetical protein CTY12_08650 [Methylotenera sp.]